MNYGRVARIIDQEYEELRRLTNERYPSTYTYCGEDWEEVAEKAQTEMSDIIDEVVGEGELVFCLYHCEGQTLTEIRESATHEQVVKVIQNHFGTMKEN